MHKDDVFISGTSINGAKSPVLGSQQGPLIVEIGQLVAWHWRLFPCCVQDKQPLLKGWPAKATCDWPTILAWSAQYTHCNWAVACGPGSGIWVLDVDGCAGVAAIDGLCQEHGGDWLNTLTAVTRRGRHYYFTYPENGTLRNSTGKLGAGLDVRADGGYALVPPSFHPSGQQYRWLDPDVPIASAPPWLITKLASSKPVPVPAIQIAALFDGHRNDGLTRLAGSLRRKGKSRDEIELELLAANIRRCKPPLEEAEVRKIATSIARYPVGGPDPLEAAWKLVQQKGLQSRYEQLVELARQLQRARSGQLIALPLERIAELLGCGVTLVSRFRKKAEAQGLLTLVERHIPHRRASLFTFNESPVELGSVELSHVSSGLVTQVSSPSYTSPTRSPSSTPAVEGKSGTDSGMIERRL